MRAQTDLQIKICERAECEIKDLCEHCSRMSLIMDLNSIPELDLEKLLAAPEIDFAHDIFGIIRHMDRNRYPGTLTGFFWPRCAKQS